MFSLQVHSTRLISWSVANGQVDLAVIGGEVPNELREILQITSYAEDELAFNSTYMPYLCKEFQIFKKEDFIQASFL